MSDIETFEDSHFLDVIIEGETSGITTREEIFAILDAK